MRHYWPIYYIPLGMGIVGVLAEKKIAEWFHKPNVLTQAAAIIVTGVIIVLLAIVLFLAERLASHTIGLAQALAVFPGVSRAGSTIHCRVGHRPRA